MVKRVTIVLDDEIARTLRMIQAKQIQDSGKWVSFSKVITNLLKKQI